MAFVFMFVLIFLNNCCCSDSMQIRMILDNLTLSMEQLNNKVSLLETLVSVTSTYLILQQLVHDQYLVT